MALWPSGHRHCCERRKCHQMMVLVISTGRMVRNVMQACFEPVLACQGFSFRVLGRLCHSLLAFHNTLCLSREAWLRSSLVRHACVRTVLPGQTAAGQRKASRLDQDSMHFRIQQQRCSDRGSLIRLPGTRLSNQKSR